MNGLQIVNSNQVLMAICARWKRIIAAGASLIYNIKRFITMFFACAEAEKDAVEGIRR